MIHLESVQWFRQRSISLCRLNPIHSGKYSSEIIIKHLSYTHHAVHCYVCPPVPKSTNCTKSLPLPLEVFFGRGDKKDKDLKRKLHFPNIQLEGRFSINEEEVLSSRSHGGFTQHALLVLKGQHRAESEDERFTFVCRTHGL